MPPERDDSTQASGVLRAQQDALAAYIRDPDQVAPPPGIEQRRLRIYRDLFFNNVSGMLSGNFPVIHRIYGEARWQALLRGFYRDHDCHTPLFTELAREFLRYLDSPAAAAHPPWLRELAHYEWIELALQISEAADSDVAHDPDGDLLEGRPALSPLAWPLAYVWPVHRIGPDFQPDVPPDAPTLLLVHRETIGTIRFHEFNPLTYRLLQRLDEAPELDCRAQLCALAGEAGRNDLDVFIAEGLAMLANWREAGVVIGTHAEAAH
ncbi:MAG: putative DNA-binding domain-containing protein [Pseudomonadota bacterium]|nr:putative DNA-binding domain-containing protein [Pseudomonadota bacterium]